MMLVFFAKSIKSCLMDIRKKNESKGEDTPMILVIMLSNRPAGRRQYAYRTPPDDLPITGQPPGDNMNIGR